MALALFALAGVFFFLSVYLTILDIFLEVPLGSWLQKHDFGAFIVGVGSGIAGWILLWRMLGRTPPSWALFAAVIVPLALAALAGSFRIWCESPSAFRRIVCVFAGFAPAGVVAWWVARGGLEGAAAIALWVVATALISGATWYLREWRSPHLRLHAETTLAIFVTEEFEAKSWAMQISGALKDWPKNFKPEKWSDQQREIMARYLANTSMVHWKEKQFALVLHYLAALFSCALWWASPNYGWLGLAGIVLGFLPPAITWWQGRAQQGERKVLLGRSARVHELVFVSCVIYLLGQVSWAVVSLTAR